MSSGLIRNEDVAYVRENVRIDEVISDYLSLKQAGGDQKKGLCPFHDEKSPSFNVTLSKGYFHCFGCGKGGDVTIQVIPEYYGAYVDTCRVYIKYGTLDAPAGNLYDDSSVCTLIGGIPTATFSNLKTGLYYFLAIGYHQEGGHPPDVKGSAQKTVQTGGATTVYIPTTWFIP